MTYEEIMKDDSIDFVLFRKENGSFSILRKRVFEVKDLMGFAFDKVDKNIAYFKPMEKV